MSLEKSWKLMLGDTELAMLIFERNETPWTYRRLIPKEYFKPYRKLFVDEDTWDDDDQELDKLIEEKNQRGLTLVSNDNSKTLSEFRLHVEDDSAWFR